MIGAQTKMKMKLNKQRKRVESTGQVLIQQPLTCTNQIVDLVQENETSATTLSELPSEGPDYQQVGNLLEADDLLEMIMQESPKIQTSRMTSQKMRIALARRGKAPRPSSNRRNQDKTTPDEGGVKTMGQQFAIPTSPQGLAGNELLNRRADPTPHLGDCKQTWERDLKNKTVLDRIESKESFRLNSTSKHAQQLSTSEHKTGLVEIQQPPYRKLGTRQNILSRPPCDPKMVSRQSFDPNRTSRHSSDVSRYSCDPCSTRQSSDLTPLTGQITERHHLSEQSSERSYTAGQSSDRKLESTQCPDRTDGRRQTPGRNTERKPLSDGQISWQSSDRKLVLRQLSDRNVVSRQSPNAKIASKSRSDRKCAPEQSPHRQHQAIITESSEGNVGSIQSSQSKHELGELLDRNMRSWHPSGIDQKPMETFEGKPKWNQVSGMKYGPEGLIRSKQMDTVRTSGKETTAKGTARRTRSLPRGAKNSGCGKSLQGKYDFGAWKGSPDLPFAGRVDAPKTERITASRKLKNVDCDGFVEATDGDSTTDSYLQFTLSPVPGVDDESGCLDHSTSVLRAPERKGSSPKLGRRMAPRSAWNRTQSAQQGILDAILPVVSPVLNVRRKCCSTLASLRPRIHLYSKHDDPDEHNRSRENFAEQWRRLP